ncbi:MAG: hypothetical protein ACI9X4_002879 [Glaciecola sp.]|jgi:hypothetical protein
MKLPISAALLLTLPIVSLMPAAAMPTVPQEAKQDSTQEHRQELAQVGKRMLESEQDGNRELFEKLEDRLDELMMKLGTDGSHDEGMVLLRSVFAEFEPAALEMLEMEIEHDPVQQTQQQLLGLESALEFFMFGLERYPTTVEGLQILLSGGELGIPLTNEVMLNDGWGQPFAYKQTSDRTFELSSAGPDMILGTLDDVLLGSSDDGESSPLITLDIISTLNPGDKVAKVVMAKNGPTVACSVERGKKQLVIVNGIEHPIFDQVRYPNVSPTGNVVVYTAQLEGQKFLVVNGAKHEIAEYPLGGVSFLDNSDIFAAPFHGASSGIEWTLGDGNWLLSHSDKSYRPSIYPPVTSHDYHPLAVRAKHEGKWVVHDRGTTSEPSQWASQPAAIPGKRAVTYRYGDRNTTTVIVEGEKVGVHHWARNPVFSADGSNFAYVVSIGGQPTQHFEAMSNLDPKDGSLASILYGPAYSGGTYNVIFNQEVGPPFAYVKDPVFNPDGSNIAYVVQLEDGKKAVYHNGSTSSGYKYVDFITFDRSGTTSAFVGTKDDVMYLVVDGKESSACKKIYDIAGGTNGTFAYVSINAQDKKFLTKGWSSLGPFDEIEDVGFMSDGKTPFAQVRNNDKHGIIIGQVVPGWFDEIKSVISTQEYPIPTYMARDGESWHVVTGNKIGPAFQELQKPVVLADGRVVYIGISADQQPQGPDGTPGATQQTTHVMVDGEPQPSCMVRHGIEVSRDGFRAYYRADFEDGTECVVEVGGPSYTPKDASIEFVQFDDENRLIIKESGEGYARLIIDNVTQPAYDDLYTISIRTTPAPLTAKVAMGEKSAFVSGSLISPYFDRITDPIYSPDGQILACRGRNEESWQLIIGKWTSQRFDEVFAPRFTKDGKNVQCGVRIDSDLFLLTINLNGIDY